MDIGGESVTEKLRQEIDQLRQSKVRELKVLYRELFGEESPSCNRVHLFRRVAWRLQARALGDLSERAQQRASVLADDAELRRRAPLAFWRGLTRNSEAGDQRRDPRLPPVGTELKRIYQGRPITVRVEESGFRYAGESFASLSAVVYRATGTRWNGYLFFKLPAEPAGE